MPKVKDIGIGKHLDSWESRKRKKEEAERKEREKREKLSRKTESYKTKTKYNRAKKSYAKSKGKRRLAGSGVSLSKIFK